jgi:hypothetical protein
LREATVKMHVKEIGCEIDWIYLAQEMIQFWFVMNMMMKYNIPQRQ